MKKKIVQPKIVINKVKPGMSIFLGTGVSEPRTLVKQLMLTRVGNLNDLELIQLLSLGETCSPEAIHSRNFRLKTFISGYMSRAIRDGHVDLIPVRFAGIPELFKSGKIHVDAAFVQITPPDKTGHCSLGVSLDVARIAMKKASLVVGEINPNIPVTFGDTFVHLSEFDFIIESNEEPIYIKRWKIDATLNKLASNIADLIEDKSCISFSIGPLFEALSKQLMNKRHLGIHSPIFTDALMELVQSGAVTNRYKGMFLGKCATSYAFGSPELLTWLHTNPLIEFQTVEHIFNPFYIGQNSNVVVIVPARRIDLSGRIVLHSGVGNIATGPIELFDFIKGAEISIGGKVIVGIPSRNNKGNSNISLSAAKSQNKFGSEESIDMIVTEYGVANIKGLSLRERAQSLIDIAHPEDREALVVEAKENNILYPDQIFIPESSSLYPDNIYEEETVKGDLKVRFRPIKPSDEEQMRRLFYSFSNQSIYARYFANISTMPHEKMQEYVNVNWRETFSVVGLIGPPGQGQIIAEGRYIKLSSGPFAELAFVVDDAYQNRGISTCLVKIVHQVAKKNGIKMFLFEVLFSNVAMMKVFQKTFKKIETSLEEGVYHAKVIL